MMKHRYCANVNEHLHYGKELGVEQYEQARHGAEGDYKHQSSPEQVLKSEHKN